MKLTHSLLVSTLVFVFTSVSLGEETTKTFAKQACSYTLPGPDWEWIDVSAATDAICGAKSSEGIVFSLRTIAEPKLRTLDDKFFVGFERGMKQNKELKVEKRGLTAITFQGQPAHRLDISYNSLQRTAAATLFLANGFIYELQVIGGDTPVETLPEYQPILNGFKFTRPPVSPALLPPVKERVPLTAEEQGQRFGYSIGIALVALFFLFKGLKWALSKVLPNVNA